MDRVHQIFDLPEGNGAVTPVRRIILERHDVNAEFESWRRAQSTGNWGTNPEAQARVVAAARNGSSTRLAFHKTHNTGCRGCDYEAVAKNQAMANSIGPTRFAFQHRAWFRFANDIEPHSPLLHIYSGRLIIKPRVDR
jgi:hypothetical protein